MYFYSDDVVYGPVFIKGNTTPETRNNDRIINQIIRIVGRQEYVELEQRQAWDGADGTDAWKNEGLYNVQVEVSDQ